MDLEINPGYESKWRDALIERRDHSQHQLDLLEGRSPLEPVELGRPGWKSTRTAAEWRALFDEQIHNANAALDAEGPWTDEADCYVGLLEDFPVLIVRNHHGSLCGYLGLPLDHPWPAELDEENSYIYGVNVHGGITYNEVGPHHADPGQRTNLFWVGFDCAHHLDYVPSMSPMFPDDTPTYRTVEYVYCELQDLAAQASKAASAAP